LIRSILGSSLRYGLYDPIKHLLSHGNNNIPYYKKLLAGLSSGAIASIVGTPISTIKTRMMCDDKHSKKFISAYNDGIQ